MLVNIELQIDLTLTQQAIDFLSISRIILV